MLDSDFKLLINGELVDGVGTMPVINPATGAPATTKCPTASDAQLDAAVAAAKAAFPAWKATSLEDRKAAMLAIADGIEANAEEMAKIHVTEMGRPFPESMRAVHGAAAFFRYFTSLDIPVETIADPEGRIVEVHREPMGVCALITPWNFPLMLIAFKLPTALLTGNTVVLKPSSTTPLIAAKLCEIIADKVPPGVVNLVIGEGGLGAKLSKHPDVVKVSFTGSTATGQKIMEAAAPTLKRLTLELGGNDAGIVLDDFKVGEGENAIGLFMSSFYNSGQICIAIKRLYVHDSIYDDVVGALAGIAAMIPVGDGFTEGVVMGPVQNEKQYAFVKQLINSAESDGTVLVDGPLPDNDGYWIRPTIVRDVSNGDRIVDEEQFGPVLPVIRYSNVEDAIAMANDSEFGLAASVWSSDIERAKKVAMQLEAGTCWINKHADPAPHIPFSGVKMSGFGVELGPHSIKEFTQLRVISH